MFKSLLIFTLLFTFSSVVLAKDSSVGCGLGSMIFQKNSVLSATLAATTNGVCSNQLFGITSGTSGCSQHSIVKSDMAPVMYAEANKENLLVDVARGKGEFLTAFVETLGCNDQNKEEIYKTFQDNYGKIFKSPIISPYEMLNNFKEVINNNPQTRNKCKYAVI